MKTKSLIAIAAILAVNTLVACQPLESQRPLNSTALPVGQGTALNQGDVLNQGNGQGQPTWGQTQGTSDRGGGGNLINGKPLDFYAVDITEWPEYKTYLQPRIAAIDERLRDTTVLQMLAREINWYVVPVALDQLPAAKINAPFASTQGARQLDGEVYMDENILDAMDEEERAKLVFHELVMAFYRLKFQDASYVCRSTTKAEDRQGCLDYLMENSESSSLQPVKQSEFLKEGQYVAIRKATTWLYKNAGKVSRKELMNFLFDQDFDDRFFSRTHANDEDIRSEQENISGTQLVNLLTQMSTPNSRIQHCDFGEGRPAKARAICKVSFEVLENELKLKIKTVTAAGKSIVKDLSFKIQKTSRWSIGMKAVTFRNGYSLKVVSLQEVESRPLRNGDLHIGLNILLKPYGDSYELKGIDLDTFRVHAGRVGQAGAVETFSYRREPLPEELKPFGLIFSEPQVPAYLEEFEVF